MVLERVGVWSAARLAAVLYASLGLFIGAIFALFALFAGGIAALAAESGEAPPAFLGVIFGVGAIVFLPLLYGALGGLMAAIMAGLYNLLARMVGGIEVVLR